jgi:F-type H+-transporting ATPase subunit a
MAAAVFLSSILIGLRNQGFGYFRHFCPSGIPGYLAPFFIVIELMSFFFRPISLGIRLFANMVAGHIMIKVIAGFAVSIAGITFISYFAAIPVIINVLLNIFKLAVCMLQAYVFVVLSCMYLSESLEVSTQHRKEKEN